MSIQDMDDNLRENVGDSVFSELWEAIGQYPHPL